MSAYVSPPHDEYDGVGSPEKGKLDTVAQNQDAISILKKPSIS
jgi:hypothetical protein